MVNLIFILIFGFVTWSSSEKTYIRNADGHLEVYDKGQKFIRPCFINIQSVNREGQAKYNGRYYRNLCTHLIFGHMKLANNGRDGYIFDDIDIEQMRKVLNLFWDHKLPKILSVGGNVTDDEVWNKTKDIVRLVGQMVDFMGQNYMNGISLDWEYPYNDEQKKKFLEIMECLRTEMHALAHRMLGRPKPFILTTSVSTGRLGEGYDVVKLEKYVDFVILTQHKPVFDFSSSMLPNLIFFNEPGMSPAIQNATMVISANNWYKLGMPKSKIILEVAAFGRGFTHNVRIPNRMFTDEGIRLPGTNISGIAAYHEICELIDRGGKTGTIEGDLQSYVIWNNQWYSFENKDSLKKKTDFVKANQYGGIFMFSLDLDDFDSRCNSSSREGFPLTSIVAWELSKIKIVSKDPLECSPRQNRGFETSPKCWKYKECLDGTLYTRYCPSQGFIYNESAQKCSYTLTGSECDKESIEFVSPLSSKFMRPCFISFDNIIKKAPFNSSFYIPGLCTHIVFDRVHLTANGIRENLPNSKEVNIIQELKRMKILDQNLKFIISIDLKGIIPKNKNESDFLVSYDSDNLITFLSRHKFDGVNFDISGITDLYGNKEFVSQKGPGIFDDFLKDFKMSLEELAYRKRKSRIYLSLKVNGHSHSSGLFDFKYNNETVDFVFVDVSVTNVKHLKYPHYIKHGTMGLHVPNKKMIIGISSSALGYRVAENVTKFSDLHEKGEYIEQIPYYEVLCELSRKKYGKAHHQKWFGVDYDYMLWNNGSDRRLYSYETPLTIKQKMTWIRSAKYGGAYISALNMDNYYNGCGQHVYRLETVHMYPLTKSIVEASGDREIWNEQKVYRTSLCDDKD